MRVHILVAIDVRDEQTAQDFSWIIENIVVFVGDNVYIDVSMEDHE